jgi:hypothetical protein
VTVHMHCDYHGCGEVATDERVGWLVVEPDPEGASLAKMSRQSGPWHFCSWLHLAAFAQAT